MLCSFGRRNRVNRRRSKLHGVASEESLPTLEDVDFYINSIKAESRVDGPRTPHLHHMLDFVGSGRDFGWFPALVGRKYATRS